MLDASEYIVAVIASQVQEHETIVPGRDPPASHITNVATEEVMTTLKTSKNRPIATYCNSKPVMFAIL